jgi:MFS family permease
MDVFPSPAPHVAALPRPQHRDRVTGPLPHTRPTLTLWLTTLLHAFTHAYGTILVPLYLMIAADLHLRGVGPVALVVTIYSLVYALGSYGAGMLADRFDRRMLLGIGLIGNALAVVAFGLTRSYELLVVLGILAGVFGTLFHPCANSLITEHYPSSPGMAIGLLGIGAGVGFFAGPQFAGWRAQAARWQWGVVADWQRPCIELGVVGVVCGAAYLVLAREARTRGSWVGGRESEGRQNPHDAPTHDPRRTTHALPRTMRKRVIALAALLGWRDFAGIAAPSLLSIYLQKAHGYGVKQAGFAIGSMMLLSVVVNPLAVYLSPGRRRLPALSIVLVLAGLVTMLVPLLRVGWVVPVMCVAQSLSMGSYAISDAAMLERVAAAVRGRVVGLFLTLAGTMSSLAPWVMGFWTDLLKGRATQPLAYVPLFAAVGVTLFVAAFSPMILTHLGPVQGPPIDPLTETDPPKAEVLA